MVLGEYLEKTGMSVYALSKRSEVPYTTILSICRGKADIEECRLGTLRAIAKALGVSLNDLIDGKLAPMGRFIDGSVDLDIASLPLPLQKFIKELEEYDRNGDPAFYAECVAPLVARLDAYTGRVKPDMTDEDVMDVYENAAKDWLNIEFIVSDLRRRYLERTLVNAE